MLGICNGFQALIKLGLVPYGRITQIQENDPTLTFNTLGRHVSRMVYTRVTSRQIPVADGSGSRPDPYRSGFPWRGPFCSGCPDSGAADGQRPDRHPIRGSGWESQHDIQWNPNAPCVLSRVSPARMAGFWARWATLSGREKTCTVMCLAKRTSSCSRPA